MKVFKRICAIFFVIFIGISFCGCGDSLKKASKNLTSIYLEVELNDDANKLNVKQKTNFINASENKISSIYFNVFANVYAQNSANPPVSKAIESLAYKNGKSFGSFNLTTLSNDATNLNYEFLQGGTILKINLNSAIYPQERMELNAEYEVDLANISHRLGYFDGTYSLAHFYLAPCKLNADGSFYYAPYSTFGDPFVFDSCNFSAKLNFPKDYVIACTGSLNKGGNYEALAVRDFAIIASKNFKVVEKKTGKTIIKYYYVNDNNPQEKIDLSVSVYKFLCDNYGKNDSQILSVVQAPLTSGGMEYANIATVANSIPPDREIFKEVIVHEIIHQWWFNIVGNNQIEEPWLDEALTEFCTAYYFAKQSDNPNYLREHFGKTLEQLIVFSEINESIFGKTDLAIGRKLNEFNTDTEYSNVVYGEGSLMFYNLFEMIGEKKFNKSLKSYFINNSFSVADKGDLIYEFQKNTKANLEEYFAHWLSGNVNLCEL